MVGLFGGAAKFPLPAIVTDAKQIAGIYAGSLEHLRQLVKTFTSHKVFMLFCSTSNLQKCLLIAECFGKLVLMNVLLEELMLTIALLSYGNRKLQ